MPLVATRGAASAQGFGEFAQSAGPTYIEDVFSTYLYTGNGSTQTITNGIDFAGKGGLVWIKQRDGATARQHVLVDTVRGAGKTLASNLTSAETTDQSVSAFSSTGFTVTDANPPKASNDSPINYVSWTFRKQPKFFDVVTYTGNGTTQTISHSLGSVPGFIIVKRTNSAEDWWCFHRYDFTYRFKLNATNAAVNTTSVKYLGNNVIDVAPTSTTFTVGDTGGLNGSGDSFVAYLFAHDAGGFGLSGSDNVISCGSFTTNGSGVASVSLGYEPQLILWKRTDSTSDWYILDTMRGLTADPANSVAGLRPNLSNAETTALTGWSINATGFGWSAGAASATYIYIAIRRGPMKTPTSGTSVFAPVRYTTSPEGFITGFPVDFGIAGNAAGTDKWYWQSRLQGAVLLNSASTAAEVGSGSAKFDMMNGYGTGFSTAYWADAFRRAPGFFDVVCYTGTGSATTVAHNLGVVPEMMIVKRRNSTGEWKVYLSALGNNNELVLNSTGNIGATDAWNDTTPTSSVFSIGSPLDVSGGTFVAYLFATCAGVSKVGSYTGTGTTLQINCGFTGGARFVLIKRSDNSGSPQNWYVWDSARGIVAGNDPYLLLNSTAAEVTNTDYVDTYSAGFEISSTAPAAINANGGTFIFLAIA